MLYLPNNQWLSLAALEQYELSSTQLLWLSHQDSMTRLIRAHCQSEFALEVITEGMKRPYQSEIDTLAIASDEAYVREVKMIADEADWLYGRSIFPHGSLDGDGDAVKQLGSKPLGRLLFKDNLKPRESIEVALLSPDHELLSGAPLGESNDQSLLARRSLFRYHDRQVLVQEVFLPDHPLYK